MTPETIAQMLRTGLPDTQISVQSEDNTHFAALLVGEVFAGLKPLARHQLVYRCLGELVGREIHALSINAFTPDEWEARHHG